MAGFGGFGDYPPNMTPQDALVVRSQAGPEHAVTKYSSDSLSRPSFGPANPFREESTQSSLKRKNVLTGTATETFLSEHTFRSKHRAVERRGGPEREFVSGKDIKEINARVRSSRESKGNATISDGDGAYIGPWAKFKRPAMYEDIAADDDLGSGDEYEVVEDDGEGRGGEGVDEGEEEDDVVESGTVVPAPAEALARRKEVEEMGDETTTFHGSEMYDYQGRTYMHVPQDLDIDLRKELGSVTNYIPRKLVHTWRSPSPKPVTALRLFPDSGHLLLSGGADNTVRIWDVYHERELLRSFSGHSKAITDLSFNLGGTQFISGSHDRWMKLWDTESGRCITRFRTGKTPHCVVFNPSPESSHEFLSGMSDNKILQWDTRAGNEPVQEYNHHLAPILTVTFLAGSGQRFMTTSDDKSVRVWDYNIPVPISYTSETWMYPMTRSALHPSKKWVAFQSSDNQVVVYSAHEKFRQNKKKSYRGHNSAGTAVGIDYSPDGQFLVSGDAFGFAYFYDVKTCKLYEKLKVDAAGGAVTNVLWHPQETSKVITAGAQGDIKLWD